MLSLTIFLNTVSEIIPITSDSPLIGTYFNCIMFMVASSVVTTIMVLNYHHRMVDTHDMPDWVKSLFLQWLPWLLRMSRYSLAEAGDNSTSSHPDGKISDPEKRLL